EPRDAPDDGLVQEDIPAREHDETVGVQADDEAAELPGRGEAQPHLAESTRRGRRKVDARTVPAKPAEAPEQTGRRGGEVSATGHARSPRAQGHGAAISFGHSRGESPVP